MVNQLIGNHGLGILQGQTRIANSKSAYKSLSLGPRSLKCENIL